MRQSALTCTKTWGTRWRSCTAIRSTRSSCSWRGILKKRGIAEKARIYLERAGRQAAARFANDEAIAYFSRALNLTPENRLDERYALLLAREQIYGLQGERELQAQDMAACRSWPRSWATIGSGPR